MQSSDPRIHDAVCGAIITFALLFVITALVVIPFKTLLGMLAVLFFLNIIHNITS